MLQEIIACSPQPHPLRGMLRRHHPRLTHVKVARVLGVSRAYLTQILNGYCSPSEALTEKLDELESELREKNGRENANVL
jgi:transcriptional regulator with XRE-family HTH domain